THFSCDAPPTPDIHPLSLHDALPISHDRNDGCRAREYSRFVEHHCRNEHSAEPNPAERCPGGLGDSSYDTWTDYGNERPEAEFRSEEHTSELQSRENLVCRLLLEKKK